MQTRTLGQGLEVSALGLGCMGMSFAYGPAPDRQEMIALDPRARSSAASPSSTPPQVYGAVHQRGAGRRGARARPRARSSIATKFGFDLEPAADAGRAAWTAGPSTSGRSPRGSLQRLRIDHIDLFYQHRVDPDVPIEEVAGTVKELIAEGKVRHFGLSEAGVADHPPRPRRAAGHRDPERVLAVVARAGGGTAADPRGARHRSRALQPARQGLPDRQDRRDRPRSPRTTSASIVPRFTREAREGEPGARRPAGGDRRAQEARRRRRSRSPGCWRRSRGSSRSRARPSCTACEENLGAAELELTPADLRDLEAAAARIHIQGDRYPTELQRRVGR